MKDRKYFVLAVSFALIVPIIFGGVYFYHTAESANGNKTILKLESRREVIFFGEEEIRDISTKVLHSNDYKNANFIEFEVDYAAGLDPITTYNLIIKDIKMPPREDGRKASWRLEIFDVERADYRLINKGTFYLKDDKIELGKFQIVVTEAHHFRLYYYLNSQMDKNGFSAKVDIE